MRATAFYLIILSLFPLLGISQDIEAAVTDPDTTFFQARDLAFDGRYAEARILLEAILTEYPDYSDVQNLLAKTYSWEGQFEKARVHFDRIIGRDTANQEVWVAMIHNELYAKNEIMALSKVNKALDFFPGDPELLALKHRTDRLLKQKNTALRTHHHSLSVDNTETGNYSNSLGAFSTVQVFDQVFDAQYGIGLEYIRQGQFGRLLPRITFANRFDQDGIQYELDLYPKLHKRSYAYLNYGYSSSVIFPRHRAGVELYHRIARTMEISAGMRYLDFRESTATTITASWGIYTGNYYLAIRPLITPRSDNPTAYFGSLLIRKYGVTPDNWIGAALNAGVEPESQQVFLGNSLLSESTRYVEIQELLFEYQFTGKQGAHLYRASAGLRHQEFLAEPGAYFWAFTAGIRYCSRF